MDRRDARERFRASVRQQCEAHIAPHAAETDRKGDFPTSCYDALRGRQWHAPQVPGLYGGLGADAISTAIVVEEAARCCATSALIPAINTLGSTTLHNYASEPLQAAYLPRIAGGHSLISFCLSEPEAGSDPQGVRTRAERRGDGYVLNGVKRWITHAGLSSLYIVFAVTDRAARSPGISAFLVESTDGGVSFGRLEQKLGIRGSPTRDVILDDVRIPARRLIGRRGEGLRVALDALDHSRVNIAAQAVGIAQGALDHATAHLRSQRMQNRSGSTGQGAEFLLADLAMRVAAARSLTCEAAVRSEQKGPDLNSYAAMAKCFAADTAMSVTTDALQLVGEAGWRTGHPLERMMRDAKATQIYEGTNQIQRMVIARALLSGDRDG